MSAVICLQPLVADGLLEVNINKVTEQGFGCFQGCGDPVQSAGFEKVVHNVKYGGKPMRVGDVCDEINCKVGPWAL